MRAPLRAPHVVATTLATKPSSSGSTDTLYDHRYDRGSGESAGATDEVRHLTVLLPALLHFSVGVSVHPSVCVSVHTSICDGIEKILTVRCIHFAVARRRSRVQVILHQVHRDTWQPTVPPPQDNQSQGACPVHHPCLCQSSRTTPRSAHPDPPPPTTTTTTTTTIHSLDAIDSFALIHGAVAHACRRKVKAS